ncbi:phosphodiester glycosidase family protein [Gorillibacterium sp. CAU 1737]|uniref:phosphodiester glycosidase family protein n=1 Tax=Gorillibacterium sp. CAU 1737 TaxID=3140362 RepID=UPI003260C8B9
MTHEKRKPRRRLLAAGLVVSLLTMGGVAYGLADRYLIEHVEAVVTPNTVAVNSDSETTASSSSSENNNSSSSGASSTSVPSAEADESTKQATADDWNYKSEDTQIAIKKVETGSGSDKVTYYVADVQVKDASSLLTAFAKNAYGRNITQDTSEIASANNAILAINGDYYGFRNDGVIIRNGTLYRNEPARDGLALYDDGTMAAYNEEEVNAEDLIAQGVTNTFSFGPVLVKDGQAVTDLENVKIDTNFGNRSIGGANPRTGIGILSANHYVFVVVDGRQANYSKGMTLTEFAQLFEDMGAKEAYNLDGGGSSTMYFNGRVVNSPGSKGQERGVSDILYIAH